MRAFFDRHHGHGFWLSSTAAVFIALILVVSGFAYVWGGAASPQYIQHRWSRFVRVGIGEGQLIILYHRSVYDRGAAMRLDGGAAPAIYAIADVGEFDLPGYPFLWFGISETGQYSNTTRGVSIPLWMPLLVSIWMMRISSIRNPLVPSAPARRQWRGRPWLIGLGGLVFCGIAWRVASLNFAAQVAAYAALSEYDHLQNPSTEPTVEPENMTDHEATQRVRHEMDWFVCALEDYANEHGGLLPGPDINAAIAAVRRGSSIEPGEIAPHHCQMMLRNRDPWGHPFVYTLSADRTSGRISTSGPPPGSQSPITMEVEPKDDAGVTGVKNLP